MHFIKKLLALAVAPSHPQVIFTGSHDRRLPRYARNKSMDRLVMQLPQDYSVRGMVEPSWTKLTGAHI
jgi:hypothetical protein